MALSASNKLNISNATKTLFLLRGQNLRLSFKKILETPRPLSTIFKTSLRGISNIN